MLQPNRMMLVNIPRELVMQHGLVLVRVLYRRAMRNNRKIFFKKADLVSIILRLFQCVRIRLTKGRLEKDLLAGMRKVILLSLFFIAVLIINFIQLTNLLLTDSNKTRY